MSIISKEELIKLLYEHADDFGIPRDKIPQYVQQIRESLEDPQRGGTVYQIPRGKEFVVTIKDAPYAVVAIFDKYGISIGNERFNLHETYNIVGREALIGVEKTPEGKKSYIYKFSRQESTNKYSSGERALISRIQLIVKKEGNSIYIQNVGKNEIEILSHEVWEERVKGKLPYDYSKKSSNDKERKILFGISILMVLLASLLVSSFVSSVGFFGLASGEATTFSTIAFIFLFLMMFVASRIF